MGLTMNWLELAGNFALVPPRPKAIVHFLGGAFVASAPHVTYGCLLEALARQGYAVIATPFVNTFDHAAIAGEVLNRFEQGLSRLQQSGTLRKTSLPIYGIGHSMGSKLHLLIGSLFVLNRAGNITISFNNFPLRRSIPFAEQFAPLMSMEFSPTPEETFELIDTQYCIRRNLLVRFNNDTLDQTTNVDRILQKRFPNFVTLRTLNGTHTTPLARDLEWQTGESFSAIDAMGQWLNQQVNRDLYRLQQEILLWLDPVGTMRRR